ncbi:MAG: hypothetical protein AB1468_01355 [Candidatus Micrarchaeota archaeon]
MKERKEGVGFSVGVTTSRKELARGRGRPGFLNEAQIQYAVELYLYESLSVRDIADVLGVSHMCIWRALNKLGEKDGNGGDGQDGREEAEEVMVVPCKR